MKRLVVIVVAVAAFVGLQFLAAAVGDQFQSHDAGFTARILTSLAGGVVIGVMATTIWREV